MSNDHFAIVIGVASYPKMPGPPPADLRGPVKDAEAVAKWLACPGGGGLPVKNINLYTSTTFGAPPADEPAPHQLNDAMRWVDKLFADNGGMPRQRLYLYCSGHGFAPGEDKACLVTGNAYVDAYNDANITPTAWIDWLRDAS